jgi:hypothetical protein
MTTPDLPEQLREYLPSGLLVRQVNAWDTEGADGSRRGTVTLDIVGAPVHVRGTAMLQSHGPNSCELAYVTHLRSTIPFAAATIERAAAPAVRDALRAERDELFARLALPPAPD